jgi:hypothetical protein
MKLRDLGAALAVVVVSTAAAGASPSLKEGLLVPNAREREVRAAMQKLAGDEAMTDRRRGIATCADKLVAEWPDLEKKLAPTVGGMLDLSESKELSGVHRSLSGLGFMYFVSGDVRYAHTAFDILELTARIPRWGWYNWGGANMPQIHYGMCARNAAFCVDFC